MDSTKIVKIFDTSINRKDTLVKHTITVETTKKCDCTFNWCDCKLLSDLIWPITILILTAVFYRKIRNLLGHITGRAKRFKFGNIEVELELEELYKQTEKVEKTISDKGLKFKSSKGEKEPLDFDYVITSDLPTEILKISIEIERTLRNIYDLTNFDKTQKPLAVSVLIETLRENKIIDLEQTKMLRQFWIFRNNIVHAVKYTVTEIEFLSFMDIGLKVLKILKTIQNNLSNKSSD